MAGLKKAQRELLARIEEATKQEPGYLMVDRSDNLKLLIPEYVELNEGMTTGNQVAARAKSIIGEGSSVSTTATPNGVASASVYEVLSGIPLSEPKRGGKKEEQYPFSQMKIGDSFVVPATDSYPKPWETFASTVSSATRRFSEKSATETYKGRDGAVKPKLVATRKFTLRRVTKGDAYPNGYMEPATGARVFRTA